MLKEWGVPGKDWDAYSIEKKTMVNVFVKPDKAQEMIDLMDDDKRKDMAQGLLDQNIFPFT